MPAERLHDPATAFMNRPGSFKNEAAWIRFGRPANATKILKSVES